MNLIAILWWMIAAASASVAVLHGHVWLRMPSARANAAFALCAGSLAMIAVVELQMIQAETPEQYGRMLWLYHFPVWLAMVGAVMFIWFHMRAGRAWLGWTVIALRTLAMLYNAWATPNMNFLEITSIERVPWLGGSVAVAQGVPDPWMALGTLSVLGLACFIADASVTLWRRGEHRRALGVGGTFALFVTAAAVMAWVAVWSATKIPVLVTLFFLPIIVTMGIEVSADLIRSVGRAEALQRTESELRETQARLRLAADAAQVGLWSIELGSGRRRRSSAPRC